MREAILMALCSFLQNRRFCPNLEPAVLSLFEIGGFVSFKIGCFVLPPSVSYVVNPVAIVLGS